MRELGLRCGSVVASARRSRPAVMAACVVVASLLLGAASGSYAAERPSFDCAKAGAPTERAICGSDALAALDRDIAALYRQRRARAPSTRSVDDQQRQWLAVRDGCNADATCLEKEMSTRKSDLQELVARFAKAPATDKSGFTGAYENASGTAEVEAVSSNEFDVTISTGERTGRWVCDFSGTGQLKGNAIVINHKAEVGDAVVVVTLRRKDGQLTVSEERTDQADYCGHNGYIEGTYRAVKAQASGRSAR
jgi:uncharacterized protein